jgi:hypothetical protein
VPALMRAKSEGKQLGRPPLSPELEIRKALNDPDRIGGIRVIAQGLGAAICAPDLNLSRSIYFASPLCRRAPFDPALDVARAVGA